MKNHYGYFSNTKGHDGDHIDVFVGNYLDFDKIYVVDQNYPDGSFDESKVEHIHFSVMVKSRKVRYGKQLCLLEQRNLIIS